MAEDLDKINEIFRLHDEQAAASGRHPASEKGSREKAAAIKAVDKLLIDEEGEQIHNYTGDAESERDYHPVRQSHEYKSGCLGGIMYFVFILCISVILACLAWMAASDMLALNKGDFTAKVNLPMSIFTSETVDTFDDKGNKTGTERVTTADIDYVADALKEAGLIEYKWLFEAFCRVSHAETKVRPGEYELQSSFDYRALVQNMRPGSGASLTIDVTFPEGFNMRQIFMRLEENGVSSFDDLMQAAAEYKFNYSFLEDMETGEAVRLEGYLFPDTYQFYVGMQASSAINKFLENFHYVWTDDMMQMAENRGLSIREVITVASMIEREAADDTERGRIASVIYNRLKAGMPLGLESTILYAHPEHEGAPSAEMIAEDSPYNTLNRKGLPPTPICNPGRASIYAALSPEMTNYYYFTLDTATGTHRFFANYYEFEAFVATQDYGG
ncbi:MAG: endolytic transglycosylase MltG [Oscillospiraceae bacterium]|nr:endolytic transglycosylase MltG [Oscillospiraceae bacterium]